MVDCDGSKALMARSSSKDKTMTLVNHMWHVIMKEPGSDEPEGGLQWYLSDTSTNGTWVKNSEGSMRLEKGTKYRLSPNDIIQLSMPPVQTLEFQFTLQSTPVPATLKRKAPSSFEPVVSHGGSSPPGNGVEKEVQEHEARARKKASPPLPLPPPVPQHNKAEHHQMAPPAPSRAMSPLPMASLHHAGIVSPAAVDLNKSSDALISASYERQVSELQSRLVKTRAMADDSHSELVKEREKVARMEREHEAAMKSVEIKADERSMALVGASNKELEATRLRLDESLSRISDLESRLLEEKSRSAQSDSSLIHHKGEIEAQRSSLLKAQGTIESLSEDLRVHAAKISSLEVTRDSLLSRLREEEGARVRAQEDLSSASRALEAQVDAKGAAQRALEGLRAQMHDQEVKRDQEHWVRVAAEAKALTLESELYDAKRAVEVLEEKVQVAVSRGDLFKIRAEVIPWGGKNEEGGERVRGMGDLARATAAAFTQLSSLTSLMHHIHTSAHEMTPALNPQPEPNPGGLEMEEEPGEGDLTTVGAGGGGGGGGGEGSLFHTPPPSTFTNNMVATTATALGADHAAADACDGGLAADGVARQEEDVVMEDGEVEEGQVHDEVIRGLGPEVITITTQMEAELDAMVVEIKVERIEEGHEGAEGAEGEEGHEGGGGHMAFEEEDHGGGEGPGGHVVETDHRDPEGGQPHDQGRPCGDGGEGEGLNAPSSPVVAFDPLTTQIMSYQGGPFGSSIMINPTAGAEPLGVDLPPLGADLPPLGADLPPLGADLPPLPPNNDGDEEDKVNDAAPITGTLMAVGAVGGEGGHEVAEEALVGDPLVEAAVPAPPFQAATSQIMDQVAPYCEYPASLIAAGTSSEGCQVEDCPPPPPPSAADIEPEASMEERIEPPQAPQTLGTSKVLASEGEGVRGNRENERMVLADIANAAL